MHIFSHKVKFYQLKSTITVSGTKEKILFFSDTN